MRQNQLGIFDISNAKTSSNGVPADGGIMNNANVAIKDNEISRLKEELAGTRSLLSSWEEKINQARTACEAWQKESAMAQKKVELALKEKGDAMSKTAQLAKEVEILSGGPHLHVVKRVADLKGMPLNMLKAIEIQPRKDLQEVEKVNLNINVLRHPINIKIHVHKSTYICNDFFVFVGNARPSGVAVVL